MREPVRIGVSTEYPVPLETLKSQVRVDGTDEDALLEIYLSAAIAHVENRTGRAIAATAWYQSFDEFPAAAFIVPFGPVLSDSVTLEYVDANGSPQTIEHSELLIDANSIEARVAYAPGGWPSTDGSIANVVLSWVSQPEACPPELIVAVLMLAGHWYNQRESVVVGTIVAEVPMAATALIESQRRFKG